MQILPYSLNIFIHQKKSPLIVLNSFIYVDFKIHLLESMIIIKILTKGLLNILKEIRYTLQRGISFGNS